MNKTRVKAIKDGKEQKFDSFKEAEEKTGVKQQYISFAVRSGKKRGGYNWVYVDKEPKPLWNIKSYTRNYYLDKFVLNAYQTKTTLQ